MYGGEIREMLCKGEALAVSRWKELMRDSNISERVPGDLQTNNRGELLVSQSFFLDRL